MKKILPLITAIVLLTMALNANAQNGFSDLIKSGPGDASKLLNAYADPLFKGFGAGMNSGWNNTAKTKKLFHFDVRISATAALVPSSDKTFDVTKIGLSNNVKPADPNLTLSPTIGGERNTPGPMLNVYANGKQVDQFALPSGKLPVIPSPQLQITIGLVKNTDITVRGIPKVSFGSDVGSVSMIGVGIKHDILRDFVGKKADNLIPVDVAIGVAYSRLNTNVALNVQPDAGAQPENNQQASDFTNQRIEAHFNSFLFQAIVSKKLLFFTPFLAVGYNTADAKAAVVGNYPVTTGSTLTNQPTYTTFTDPININENTASGLRADLGFQLNLGFFRIYASYGLAKYQTASGGIGFGF